MCGRGDLDCWASALGARDDWEAEMEVKRLLNDAVTLWASLHDGCAALSGLPEHAVAQGARDRSELVTKGLQRVWHRFIQHERGER